MFIFGIVRSTIFYVGITSLLNSASTDMLVLYLFTILVHIAVCKCKHRSRSASDIALGAIEHDVLAPFAKISIFVKVITGAHVIDDTPDHIVEDKLQVYAGAAWGIFLIGALALTLFT